MFNIIPPTPVLRKEYIWIEWLTFVLILNLSWLMSSFLKYMELLVFKISTSATYSDDTKLFIISEEKPKNIKNFFPGYHNVLETPV